MKIKELNINNLRNHSGSSLFFADGINVFRGPNGAGKTTILEAISICSFSKTFLPAQDKSLIKNDEDYYFTSLKAENDYGIPYFVKVGYQSGARKKISSSIGEHLTPKDIIGELPLVILSPDYKAITSGAPADRRLFIDRLLSQASKRYLEESVKLKRTLKQRNSLLLQNKSGKLIGRQLIEPWNNLLIECGAEIVLRRNNFIRDFLPYFREVYESVSGGKEAIDMAYAPDSVPEEAINNDITKEEIADFLRKELNSCFENELRRGSTLFGPQKDEIKISVNSGPAREYASQGQHKSLLISLKFAEFNFLKNKRNETPVILFDDIFSELDMERALKTMELIGAGSAQTFITSADSSFIERLSPAFADFKKFDVVDGIVKE